jgi:hypothetical protein
MEAKREERTAIFDWIEGGYNRQRRHSRLRYPSSALSTRLRGQE